MPPESGATSAIIKPRESLKPYTTFKIGGPARYFVCAETPDHFRAALDLARRQGLPFFILGGGSNILVSDRGFDGVVVHPIRRGIGPIREDDESVTLEVSAAETWDDVVRQTVKGNWWGIENLSHIPGQAGAALVQNIGAYGQQVSDVLDSAQVLDCASGAVRALGADDCGFGYRRSIFNTTSRGQLIILGLTLRLTKRARRSLNYPDVRAYFAERNIAQPSLAEIRQAIIAIRDGKFPFPREERGGNAGSFFKNLSLTELDYGMLHSNLQRNFSPQDVARLEEFRKRFPSSEGIKIPTAFLIEICNLKGHRVGGAQVNERQPLVLLNQGGATAQDVLALAGHVIGAVRARTGMTLAIEPELIGFTEQDLSGIRCVEHS
jgi:UDP-N-acetylmuramate dehydrogenase